MMISKRRVTKLALIIVVLGAIFITSAYFQGRNWAIQGARDMGNLAELPSNASSVDIESIGSAFTRTFRLSFVADENEVEDFLNETPSIDTTLYWDIYAPGEMRFSDPTVRKMWGRDIYSISQVPNWIAPPIEKGRMFIVNCNYDDERHCELGKIVVDDIRHKVYFYAYWS